MAKVVSNYTGVLKEMKRDGFSFNEINEVRNHGIGSPNSSYRLGVWSKMTDSQALKYINLLYDNV